MAWLVDPDEEEGDERRLGIHLDTSHFEARYDRCNRVREPDRSPRAWTLGIRSIDFPVLALLFRNTVSQGAGRRARARATYSLSFRITLYHVRVYAARVLPSL
jgi:hypothetical protein